MKILIQKKIKVIEVAEIACDMEKKLEKKKFKCLKILKKENEKSLWLSDQIFISTHLL